MYSKISLFFILFSMTFLLMNCKPLKEKPAEQALVEIDYIDPTLAQQQNSNEPDHAITGNLNLEIQEDLVTGKKTLFAHATFHEAAAKNILFSTIPTKALKQNIFKPKPEEQPCGIEGFPDCPNEKPKPQPEPKPTPEPLPEPKPNPNPDEDQPCGIEGFPDCPAAAT